MCQIFCTKQLFRKVAQNYYQLFRKVAQNYYQLFRKGCNEVRAKI